jgi:hypothetical protein
VHSPATEAQAAQEVCEVDEEVALAFAHVQSDPKVPHAPLGSLPACLAQAAERRWPGRSQALTTCVADRGQPARAQRPQACCAAQGREATEVLQRVLRNILAAPGEAKYRRLRLRNKRIQEAVVDVAGGVELLQVGAPPAGYHDVCPAAMYPCRYCISHGLPRRLEAARLVLPQLLCWYGALFW